MPRSKRRGLAYQKFQKHDTGSKDWMDQLWDESPRVQKMKEQWRVQVYEELIKEAQIEREGLNLKIEILQRKLKEITKEKVDLKSEAKAKLDIQALQQTLVSFVHARFPDLTEFAQQQVEAFKEPAALDLLIQKIATAPDAKTARWLLDSSAEVRE